MGIITLNPLAPGAGDRQEVTPILKTWAQLKDARDAGNLIPGQYYRITDYVTTSMAANTRSAGHPFDIIVRADSKDTLNEQAWAVKHDGDTYFEGARLEAWELKYQLDNVQWSQRVGTLIEDENDGYAALSIGTVDIDGETYILWDASEFEENYGFTRMVSLTKDVGAEMWTYDPATGEKGEDVQTSIAAIVAEYTEAGKGTITWMKDEHGNECPYDFKNVQFKRWKVTDSMEGRTGFTDTYLGVLNNTAEKLSVEDAEDFIWAYTFSSDAMGGEQTDYSLDGSHSVYGNVIKEMGNGSLPDNVFFGESCYANTLSQGCNNNSFSQNCWYNSFSQECWYNSFSQGCYYNSFSQDCQYNSISQGCYYNSFSQGCSRNSFSQGCSSNSFSQGCYRNSFSQDCQHNSFSQNVQYVKLSSKYMQQVIVESGNQHLNVVCNQSTSASQPCRNIKIEQGVGNTTSEKTVTITTRNQNYQTVVKNANSVEVTA